MKALQRKAYAGLDYFRLIAALLVVAIHTSPLSGLNDTADFILTRVLARVAVPFFFMASGFFLFGNAEAGKPGSDKLTAFLKRTAFLYGAAVLLYLPLNIYAGAPGEWRRLPELLKDIAFDGTFYHLWYLPAAAVGACIAWLLLNKLNSRVAFAVSLSLYIAGLLGDSYYGLTESIPLLEAVYQSLFLFFDYTRNGLFFAPVFFMLGALLARRTKSISMKACLMGLAVSFGLMLAEGLLLQGFKLQRHDSMYLMLLPCMFFLFQSLLFLNGKSLKYLRSLSMLIYLIHPAVIVAVRGFSKAAGLQGLLIDHSIFHFLAVASVSLGASVVLVTLRNVKAVYKSEAIQRHTDRAWVELDMSHLRHNVQIFKAALPPGCKIMAVVKANAYGHGAAEISACLNRAGVDSFAVATIGEGIHLRRKGIKGEILVLGYTAASRASELFRHRLSQTVVDAEHARELNRFGKPLRIHIKVDTGMNRLGENYRRAAEIASIFDCRNLRVMGIYSHMCVPDSPQAQNVAYTNAQIRHFHELLDGLRQKRIQLPATHLQSSYGVLNYPELRCSYARIGIALYGVLSTSGPQAGDSLDLRPVLALKSKVVLVKTIEEGESVGYGREFVAQKETKVAVISIGYADGFQSSPREGKSHVLIHGRRAPVIGRICMDQLMADVTGLPGIKRGDVVTLIGRDGSEEIPAEEAAANAGTITNELLSRLSGRLERVYLC